MMVILSYIRRLECIVVMAISTEEVKQTCRQYAALGKLPS
jgi:hypothetical protein